MNIEAMTEAMTNGRDERAEAADTVRVPSGERVVTFASVSWYTLDAATLALEGIERTGSPNDCMTAGSFS
jgi:hypothetical protein